MSSLSERIAERDQLAKEIRLNNSYPSDNRRYMLLTDYICEELIREEKHLRLLVERLKEELAAAHKSCGCKEEE